jgi:hypothetical protein
MVQAREKASVIRVLNIQGAQASKVGFPDP